MEGRVDRAKNINRLKAYMLIALFAVIIAICSRITIPAAVPFTLQSLGVFLAFSVLGGKRGLICVLIYLALGFIGLPISASGQAGFAMLTGLTGGYLIGWIFFGIVFWLFEERLGRTRAIKYISMTVGMIVCYAVGAIWFAVVYSQSNSDVSVWTVLCLSVFPFVIFDAVKMALAEILSEKIKRAVKIQ